MSSWVWAGAVWHHPATSPWSPLELRDERDTADGSKLVRAYSGGKLQRGGFSGQKARLAKRRRRASLKSIDH